MIRFQENISLKPFNTFGIDVTARYFCIVQTENELLDLLQTDIYTKNRSLVLGGGSNVLFTNNFDGLVIKNELKGIECIDETDSHVNLKVGAGEAWNDLVMHCIQKNWGGLENLSLIPGTVGAAPMQNIGAYGIEVKDLIKNVEAFDRKTGSKRSFSNAECRFGYRESVFKQELKEKFFISSVTLTLTKKNHQLNTSYGAIAETLKHMNVHTPTIKNISDAVIQIRTSKLPDPSRIGNAGSFFKNPTIPKSKYEELKKTFATIPGYFSENQEVKVPAGWLIEQCGWKGKRVHNAGVHEQQALVLVNYNDAKGYEIFSLATQIKESVQRKFNIDLMMEVNIVS